MSQPADDDDNDDGGGEEEPKLPSPRTPPHAVGKKTARAIKKKTSPIPSVRRSPRAQKLTQNEILAEKMRIGASIIPGAATVS